MKEKITPKKLASRLMDARMDIHGTSYEHLLTYFNGISMPYWLIVGVDPGHYIYRARISGKDNFKHISELSYNRNPKQFGRANPPGSGVFYGSLATTEDEEPIVTLFTELPEISPNLKSEGQIDITFGKWEIRQKLFAILMLFHNDYIEKHHHFQPTINTYIENAFPKYLRNDESYKLLELIAAEYAKPSNGDNDNYKISAAYFDAMRKRFPRHIDAIIYPSVKCEGENFNIAITPEAVKNKLSLTKVATDRLYYKNSTVINDHINFCNVEQGNTQFVLQPLPGNEFPLGKDFCLNMLDEQLKK